MSRKLDRARNDLRVDLHIEWKRLKCECELDSVENEENAPPGDRHAHLILAIE